MCCLRYLGHFVKITKHFNVILVKNKMHRMRSTEYFVFFFKYLERYSRCPWSMSLSGTPVTQCKASLATIMQTQSSFESTFNEINRQHLKIKVFHLWCLSYSKIFTYRKLMSLLFYMILFIINFSSSSFPHLFHGLFLVSLLGSLKLPWRFKCNTFHTVSIVWFTL